MTIETILRQKGTDVVTIEPEAIVRRAADWLRVRNVGALVVTSGNAVLGLISEREIVHAFSRYGETVASMPVKEIMRYGVITVSPDESVSRVMQRTYLAVCSKGVTLVGNADPADRKRPCARNRTSGWNVRWPAIRA
jgi:CBS domain-containing protein